MAKNSVHIVLIWINCASWKLFHFTFVWWAKVESFIYMAEAFIQSNSQSKSKIEVCYVLKVFHQKLKLLTSEPPLSMAEMLAHATWWILFRTPIRRLLKECLVSQFLCALSIREVRGEGWFKESIRKATVTLNYSLQQWWVEKHLKTYNTLNFVADGYNSRRPHPVPLFPVSHRDHIFPPILRKWHLWKGIEILQFSCSIKTLQEAVSSTSSRWNQKSRKFWPSLRSYMFLKPTKECVFLFTTRPFWWSSPGFHNSSRNQWRMLTNRTIKYKQYKWCFCVCFRDSHIG